MRRYHSMHLHAMRLSSLKQQKRVPAPARWGSPSAALKGGAGSGGRWWCRPWARERPITGSAATPFAGDGKQKGASEGADRDDGGGDRDRVQALSTADAPIDIAQIEQQRELVEDQPERDPIEHREEIAAALRLPADLDIGEQEYDPDSPDVVMDVDGVSTAAPAVEIPKW